jgi:dynein heavy chain
LEFDERFKQIIKFNSIDQIQDFSKLAFNLSQNIISAKEKIE